MRSIAVSNAFASSFSLWFFFRGTTAPSPCLACVAYSLPILLLATHCYCKFWLPRKVLDYLGVVVRFGWRDLSPTLSL
ncbi:hypothetical protein B0T09DRAFT_334260 [Sordaria sp. MPI-SDFR-AT-0083]|nr:hypothetical protein B0T09DRAFT_334260 [Sordaria sp. MPI-SDFR-AT-0083]